MSNINANNRWVRVIRETENSFVEFEFFVGDMDLCVELILPLPAFKEFCENNRVRFLDDTETAASMQTSPGGSLKVVK
jgi:phenol hydroxylase P0 protein